MKEADREGASLSPPPHFPSEALPQPAQTGKCKGKPSCARFWKLHKQEVPAVRSQERRKRGLCRGVSGVAGTSCAPWEGQALGSG